MNKLLEIVRLTFVSARFTTWVRIFSELFFGFGTSGAHLSGHVLAIFLSFFIIGPLFATASYIANDYTDIELDKQHLSRKSRPLASGILNKQDALRAVALLLILALGLSYLISWIFFVGVILLCISQVLYTFEPFRFKRRFLLDIGVNGLSAGLRFLLGFSIGESDISQIPILFLIFAISLKIFLFIGHRLQNRNLEIKNKFNSTVAVLTTFQTNVLIMIFCVIIFISYLFAILTDPNGPRLLVVPFFILIVSLLPLMLVIKKGYLRGEEKSLFWRIYLYTSLLLFSILFYAFNH